MQIATQELAAILGKAVSDYHKPVHLVSRIIQMASNLPQNGNVATCSPWTRTNIATQMDYLADRVAASEFLRRIDVYGDLDSYEAGKAKLYDPRDTAWRQRVVSNIDFDPELAYQPMLSLDIGQGADAKWQYLSMEDLAKQDRDGAASLRKKYGIS